MTLALALALKPALLKEVSKIHETFLTFNIGSEDDDSDKRYKEIHEEMRVLDSALFDEGDDLVQSRVRKVLEYLGVRPLQPSDVIKHHILPRFKQKVALFKQNKVGVACSVTIHHGGRTCVMSLGIDCCRVGWH